MSYKKMLPLVLAALLLWTVPASAAPETTLKVAVGDPEDSEMGVVGHAFKKYVEEKTGGKVEVQCFYGGSLGDESEACHTQVGEAAKAAGLDCVLSVGALSADISRASGVGEHFNDKAAVVARLRELLAEHKIMTILVKGSRSAAMEEVVRALQETGTC